jgi:hypothetical protein
MTDISSILERDRNRRVPSHVVTADHILPMIKEIIGADDVEVVRTDDIYMDAAKYRIRMPSGIALPCMFSGLELLQNSGDHLRDLVEARVHEAFGKLVEPF